jgi:rubrerythrin
MRKKTNAKTRAKNKSCQALETALTMEEKGRQFYEGAAATCKLDECRKMFLKLAEDEVVHARRIEEIHASVAADEGWCDWDEPVPTRGQFVDLIAKTVKKHGADVNAETSDVKALRIATEMETESIRFYSAQRDAVSGRVPKRFYGQLIMEETAHFRALTDMLYYLTDPAGWFRDQERGGLDGA